MSVMTDTPKVWIGCLAAYNAGCLHGKWVDATDADEMGEARDEIIKTSPAWKLNGHAEEWFIADYDGFGGGARELGEYASFETVAEVGQAIEEHGEAFIAYLSIRDDIDGAIGDFEEAFCGKWDSEREYAYDFAENADCIDENVSEHWQPYIDWDAYTDSLFRHGDLTSVKAADYDVFVFRTV